MDQFQIGDIIAYSFQINKRHFKIVSESKFYKETNCFNLEVVLTNNILSNGQFHGGEFVGYKYTNQFLNSEWQEHKYVLVERNGKPPRMHKHPLTDMFFQSITP